MDELGQVLASNYGLNHDTIRKVFDLSLNERQKRHVIDEEKKLWDRDEKEKEREKIQREKKALEENMKRVKQQQQEKKFEELRK